MADHPKGSIVKGIVSEVDAKSAVVNLSEGVEGHLKASELGRERVDDARSALNVGDEVEARFVGVDRKNRTIMLSVKAKEEYDEAEAVKVYKNNTAESGSTSLGDLIKEQMGNNS